MTSHIKSFRSGTLQSSLPYNALHEGPEAMSSHLNVHSTYSKMSGTASPQVLIEQARACRMSHLALTEVNGLWGFIRFVQQARDNGILPIAGANVITEKDEAVLLVETQKGY